MKSPMIPRMILLKTEKPKNSKSSTIDENKIKKRIAIMTFLVRGDSNSENDFFNRSRRVGLSLFWFNGNNVSTFETIGKGGGRGL
ncbi:MAG TPA: hypothetical protein VFV38_32095 [Ktedonobacteraceae bacterium]|nr:hypothetical protein [Ktedonobacteraceae bacterium]